MLSELRKQRTGTGIFRWSVDVPFGSTSCKNQRREKFCESSRRNPAKQSLRAFFGYFLPPWAKSIIARKRKGSRLYFALRISTSTLRSNKQHTILSAAQTGTDDGPASTSMSSELRKQRTGTGIFRWSVDVPFGSTSCKNQRREKFCESSRRNPAKQSLRAFFGYFLPPWAKSIIARKRKGSRLYFALRISTSTLRSNKQHTILSAAQTGTDDGPASTSMSSELRKQRTGTGIFRWSVDASC